jgi:lysophospholipase L1-like esterase
MRRLFATAALLLVLVAGATHPWQRPVEASAVVDDGVLRTVILGDSVAHGAGDERRLGIAGPLRERGAEVVNLARNGARTANVRKLLEEERARAAVRAADVVVLSIGGNDLYGDSRARLISRAVPYVQQQRTLANVERIVETVHELNPAARVYLLGLYNPYRNTTLRTWLDRQINLWDARLISRFAAARNVTVVRINDVLDRDDRISKLDHFHPGSAGYQAIADRIAASMQAPVAAAPPPLGRRYTGR